MLVDSADVEDCPMLIFYSKKLPIQPSPYRLDSVVYKLFDVTARRLADDVI